MRNMWSCLLGCCELIFVAFLCWLFNHWWPVLLLIFLQA